VNLLAALAVCGLVRRLQSGAWIPQHASRKGIAVAIALALVALRSRPRFLAR